MSKELNFQDGNDVLKYQDSNSILKLYLSEDGNPFDISRFDALTVKFGNENGFLLQKQIDLNSIQNPQSGNVSIPLDEDIMTKLVPDDYDIELWGEVNPIIYDSESNDVNITVSDSGLVRSQAIFPSDGNLSITVDDNIKSSPFNTINAYPIDDIWQSLQKWESDTVNSLNSSITNGLQTEIGQWQGDISDKLKNELLQDLANDEGNIKQELDNLLTSSLDDLINKEINDLKTAVNSDVHNSMVTDVANQIATIKPQITSDLHNNLTNELSTELSSTLQSQLSNWESSTDTDLNNKIAQSILDKTTTMQNNLNSEFTNYIASQLGTYENNASNTITANITAQVTQNIANEFNSEDSQVRTDLENLVKGTIQNDVTNTLQQMQQNGDIYATKQQFTDFTNQINSDVQQLNLASNITESVNDINTRLNQTESVISTQSSEINSLQASLSTNSSSITSNANNISSLQASVSTNSQAISSLNNSSITYQGKISNFNQGNKQGLYKYFDGTISSTLTVIQYSDVIIQTRIDTWDSNGATFSDDGYAPKMRLSSDGGNTWSAWAELATQYDVKSIESTATSLASSLAIQNSAISSSVAFNSSAIANNSSSISSNAINISSLQSSSNLNSQSISGVQSAVNNLNNLTSIIPNINQQTSNMFGTDFNSYTEPGTYTVYAMVDNLPNGLSEGVLVVNIRDKFNEQMQMFYDRKGNIYFRGFQSYPSPTWDNWTIPSNISNAISNISSTSSQYRGSIEDADNATSQGTYTTNERTVNIPVYGPVNLGLINVICQPGSNMVIQLFSPMWHNGPMDEIWFRSQGGGSWQQWNKLATEVDVSNIQSSLTASSTAISSNSNSISANSSAISSLQSSVVSNSNGISSLQSSVTSNSNNITAIQSNVSSVQSSVANNATAIATLQSEQTNSFAYLGSLNLGNMAQNTFTVPSQVYEGPSGWWSVTFTGGFSGTSGQGLLIKLFNGTQSSNDSGRTIKYIDLNTNNIFIQSYNSTTQTAGQWDQFVKESDLLTIVNQLQNSLNNTLTFKGDTTSSNLSDNTQSGIYNLAGKAYNDLPSGYGSNAWGQLIVINTGGVCTQQLRDNGGGAYERAINSWGITAWTKLNN